MGRAGKGLSVVSALLWLSVVPPAAADSIGDCLSQDGARRIAACSELIEMPGLDDGAKSLAYAMRAFAYSLKGSFERALPDYDSAIRLDPGSAMTLNNRAWTLYRLKRPGEGLADVERSLGLAPASPHAFDTRAHIRQAMGQTSRALADYERAMRAGGESIIKLYQCGLGAHGLYLGRVDGMYSRDLRHALEACVGNQSCDPLPPEEECRSVTS